MISKSYMLCYERDFLSGHEHRSRARKITTSSNSKCEKQKPTLRSALTLRYILNGWCGMKMLRRRIKLKHSSPVGTANIIE